VSATATYLPPGLPAPQPQAVGVDAPFWAGLRQGRLLLQRCPACGNWQFGPEWLCHRCYRFDPDWVEVAPRGHIYSWARVWHPAHASLRQAMPYRVVLVELQEAPGIRLLGNLLGTASDAVLIGAAVEGIFELHSDTDPPYTLLQWQQRLA
jgi:uncharacterized OB-fold protein